jgi:hypothetical protein
MCTGTISGKHRPQERETKWFQAERAPGSFQGGEEEVEGGEDKKMKPLHISARIPTTIVTIAILMVTLRKSVGNYIQS